MVSKERGNMKKILIRIGKKIFDALDITFCLIREYYLYGIFVIIEFGCFFLQMMENTSDRLIAFETPFFGYIHNPIYFIIGFCVMIVFFAGFKQGNRYGLF